VGNCENVESDNLVEVAEKDGSGDTETNLPQHMIYREHKFEKHRNKGRKYGILTGVNFRFYTSSRFIFEFLLYRT
jgi:hypothetical protein